MPVDPRIFPIFNDMATAEEMADMQRKIDALLASTPPTQFIRQAHPGLLNMTMDYGTTAYTIPAAANGVTLTITPAIPPTSAYIFTTTEIDAAMVPIFQTVMTRDATNFQVLIQHQGTANSVDWAGTLHWLIVNWTIA